MGKPRAALRRVIDGSVIVDMTSPNPEWNGMLEFQEVLEKALYPFCRK
jgi:hypothetical protein